MPPKEKNINDTKVDRICENNIKMLNEYFPVTKKGSIKNFIMNDSLK